MKYILASGSPRRKELLKLIIPQYDCITADIEEVCPDGMENFKRPEFLALKKARYIADKNPDSLVIGADTAVFFKGEMLGKPKDREDAKKMLKMLSGNTHTVITGCGIVKGNKEVSFSVETEVEFLSLSEKEIEDYTATNEPMDKAGAYGIQGFGSVLVKGITGDYFNVVGLPVSKLNRVLKEFENK